ncbi:MAG: hypothetical protein A2Y15_00165 [Clostridiales bacterium GWF2_36_10]|nr:MAG: hypothetical protein A2Y15_00165 [Clostridiales bacterium GWF2_36_10]
MDFFDEFFLLFLKRSKLLKAFILKVVDFILWFGVILKIILIIKNILVNISYLLPTNFNLVH